MVGILSCYSSEIEALIAHSGSWMAYLAGGDSETSYISQPVTIPATYELFTLLVLDRVRKMHAVMIIFG